MSDESLILAIGRLERAISRVEARLASPPPASGVDIQLHARHEALKHETRAAIADLDRLIARAEGR